MKNITPYSLLLLASTYGCAPNAGGPNDLIGEASLAVTTVPASVQCVQIVAAGSSTVTRNLTVTGGGSSVALSVGQLPLGPVTFTGSAFTQACASIAGQTPAWVADALQVTLRPGVAASVNLNFRKYNATTVNANFLDNVTQVVAGSSSLGLVLGDGTVRSSGFFAYNTNWSSNSFTPISSLSGVTQLATGNNSGCSIYNGGSLECFGYNADGELGNGTTTTPTTPVQVGLSNVTHVAVGQGHACAISSDTLYCWGSNSSGQVGNGTTTNALSPVAPSVGLLVSAVSVGWSNTCAVTINGGGSVYCWGSNGNGQVGNNSTTNASSPVAIGLSGTVQTINGAGHTCALRADGTVKCWGSNYNGQLGTGNFNNSLVPIPVPSLTSVQQLATSSYATCARKSNGTVWCWGSDNYGELGDGTGTISNVPIQVQGLPPSAALMGAPTGNKFCSLSTDQTLYCWGDNTYWELCTPTHAEALVPVQVSP
jgi:alpha-tubulin suppressor-like RCC1 family protein